MNPIKSSLRYPAVTLTLTLGLLLLGTQAILHMPRMEDPASRSGPALWRRSIRVRPPIRWRASWRERSRSFIQVAEVRKGENVFDQRQDISL